MEIIFLIAILIVGWLAFLLWEKGRKRLTVKERNEFKARWQRIAILAERDSEKAILEGDKLLDLALKRKAVSGRTMNERLKGAQRFFSDFRGIKKAHHLRNKIVHESDFRLSEREKKEALKSIEKALRDLWS